MTMLTSHRTGYKQPEREMARNVNQNREYTRDQTPIFFLQDPILDLEISGEEADTIRILDEIMIEHDYMPSQQHAQEWHQLLTNELGGDEL